MENLVSEIVHTYKGDTGINFIDVSNLPVRRKILEILDLLTEVLFPGYTGTRTVTKSNINFIVGDILCHVYTELSDIEWEHNGLVNYDRSCKEYGYNFWHPGFSLKDLNNPDFIVIDAPPCIKFEPDQAQVIPIKISHWSDYQAGNLTLRYRIMG